MAGARLYEDKTNLGGKELDWNRLDADEQMWLLSVPPTGQIAGENGVDFQAMLKREKLRNKARGIEPGTSSVRDLADNTRIDSRTLMDNLGEERRLNRMELMEYAREEQGGRPSNSDLERLLQETGMSYKKFMLGRDYDGG